MNASTQAHQGFAIADFASGFPQKSPSKAKE
jgi:hypothetical protein